MALIFRMARPDPSVAWGFRLQGGRDFSQPLVISAVVRNGLADRHGIQPGDRVQSIGGDLTAHMTHQQAQQTVIRCGNEMELVLVRGGATLMSPSRETFSVNSPSSPRPGGFRSEATVAFNNTPAPGQQHGQNRRPKTQAEITFAAKPGPSMTSSMNVHPSGSQPRSNFNNYSQPKSYQPPQPVATQHAHKPYHNVKQPHAYAAPQPKHASVPNTTQNNSPRSGVRRGKPGDALIRHPNADRIPVCHSCHENIRGPFVVALDQCFCPNHFNCSRCGVRLVEIGFVEDQGFFYCEEDYTKFMAPHCAKCATAVVGPVVTAMEKKWHPECFTCTSCRKKISDSTFRVGDDGLPYCEQDWSSLFQVKCAKCSSPVDLIDRFIEAFGKIFHASCFLCAACQTPLEGKPFHARDGKAFCRMHANAAAIFK